MLHRQPAGAGDELGAGPDGDLGVLECQAFEIIVVGGLHIEEVEIAAAVEHHRPVARRLDDDGLVRRAVGGEVIGAFHRFGGIDAAVAGVEFRVIAIGPGMDQDDVAGLYPGARGGHRIAAAAIGIVGTHQVVERSRFLRAFPVARIDMINMAAGCGHGLGAGLHRHRPDRLAAIRIAERQLHFIGRVFLQIENRSSEHVGHLDIEDAFALIDAFMLKPQQRHRRLPGAVALLAIRHRHLRVAVVVAPDHPFKAQIDQGGRVDHQFPGFHRIHMGGRRGLCRHTDQASQQRQRNRLHEKAPSRLLSFAAHYKRL